MGPADNILFYGSSAIVLASNLFLLKKRAYRITGLAIQLIYTVLFNYGLYFRSAGGSGLVWWFYLIMANCLHFLVNIGILVNAYLLNRKSRKS